MEKFMVCSGFLGAGKTTTMMALQKRFTEKYGKAAMISNDVGSKGLVDYRYSAACDRNAVEIAEECICFVTEDLVDCLAHMKMLAKLAESYGVTLCMKAHVGASVYSTPTTLRMIEGVKNPFFGIDMDPSHIFRCGEEPENALSAVLPAMRHIHIRDCHGRQPSPGTPLQQICGTGDINLRGYVAEMVKQGYNGPVDLEVIGPDLSLADANIVAAESYGYLNACLKELGAR